MTMWLKTGERIIEEGEMGDSLFVLLSGELKVECSGRDLGRITEYGEVVGELGALTRQPRTASVSAVMASEVMVVKNVTAEALKKLPSVLEKINESIMRRYHIVSNKARMYSSITATMRRMLLQEAMVEKMEPPPRKQSILEQNEANAMRYQIRRWIDEDLALAADAEDPRIFDRIAMENDVLEAYKARLAARPWLEDTLVQRLKSAEHEWMLLEQQKEAERVIEKAHIVIQVNQILSEFESMPGIRCEMDIIRMESIVPFKTKAEALKSIYLAKNTERLESDRQRIYAERQVMLAIEAVKADAGQDVAMIISAAKKLGVGEEYEAHIRNLVLMTETTTHYIDPLPSPAQPG